ncbi:prephenate dehydratase [Candidatus Magnetominusculus xianensis]|uniref:Bifunctional chorismate mutase/prephenate dehydratase n=1 Tax=Candidatus Magnetominusculus xianensis TaxID=1748249 RepID=A0ABR5SG67_9BACT|nr:prephenate dehydratase [Candidatus Magnetominusculus xianensis]KWT87248.1 prephenate dehydratase [Candidatus Magnetominusculus xianensis]MBF0405053.1 prephenate dehydratase [Nitrospirota bacterium]
MWPIKLNPDKEQAAPDPNQVKLNEIDEQIIMLLNKRVEVVAEIASAVADADAKAELYSPSKETELIERLQKLNTGSFPNDAIKTIFKEIFCATLSLEQPMTVAYLGPQATYTHQAALKYFSSTCRYISKDSIREVFEEVESGKSSFGVVPIENSNEGAVNYTLDMFVDYNLKVYAETLLSINHHLLSKSADGEIKKIYSHPQPIAQCRKWLERHMLGIPIFESGSTAQAAAIAAEEKGAAAIGSALAAKIYDLNIIEKDIANVKDNFTRFLVISKEARGSTGNDMTLIMFTAKDQPGSLHEILSPFKKQRINLTRIESRPSKKKAWDYIFFADMEGHIEDKKVKKALEEVRKHSVYLKILGSYPHVETIER